MYWKQEVLAFRVLCDIGLKFQRKDDETKKLIGERQPRSQGLSSPHPKGSEGRNTLVQAGHVSW